MKPVLLPFEQTSSARWSIQRLIHTTRPRSGVYRTTLTLCLVLALGGCLVLAQRLWDLNAALKRSTQALNAAVAPSSPSEHRAGPAHPITLSATDRAAWARLAGALNTPWNVVFGALESATPPDVALMAIEPDAGKASVRLEAEARTLDTLLNYVQALGEAKGISQVALVKHETQDQAPNRLVRLVVEIRLQRDGP